MYQRRLAAVVALTLTIAAFQPAPAVATRPGDKTAPGTDSWVFSKSTIVRASEDTDQSAWKPHRGKHTIPLADEHLEDPVLKGAIDLHAHFGPDAFDRQWDAFEVAKIAQQRGMRGLVIKHHWSETAGLAYLVRKYAAPGLEVFGGLVLNTVEGGINPMAVRYFAEVEGHYGKIVWMPTQDSEHEVKYLKESRPYVMVAKDGVLLPQVIEVLDLIANYHLTLATGHVSSTEMLQIVAAARERGIKHIIITHPGLGAMFTDPTIDQLKQAVALGGLVEVVSYQLLSKDNDAIINVIKTLGPRNCIVSTDSGIIGSHNLADALALSARMLRKAGFSEGDLDLMFKVNPAVVLGLPPKIESGS